MKYTAVTVHTTEEGLEIVSARMDMLGITQVEIVEGEEALEKILEESAPYWDFVEPEALHQNVEPCVRAFLPWNEQGRQQMEEMEKSVAELKTMDLGIDLGSLHMDTAVVDEEDWANSWKRFFKPFRLGRLFVRPDWDETPKPEGCAELVIEPGMVFGSGQHETTRLCLGFLEKLVRTGDHVLDLGCGSGILGIGALVLGAADSKGIDIEEHAREVCRSNMERNRINPEKYEVVWGNAITEEAARDRLQGSYQIVVANIVADVIIALSPFVPAWLSEGGRFVCSGIIREREQDVRDALLKNGFTILDVQYDGEWLAMLAAPKA